MQKISSPNLKHAPHLRRLSHLVFAHYKNHAIGKEYLAHPDLFEAIKAAEDPMTGQCRQSPWRYWSYRRGANSTRIILTWQFLKILTHAIRHHHSIRSSVGWLWILFFTALSDYCLAGRIWWINWKTTSLLGHQMRKSYGMAISVLWVIPWITIWNCWLSIPPASNPACRMLCYCPLPWFRPFLWSVQHQIKQANCYCSLMLCLGYVVCSQ